MPAPMPQCRWRGEQQTLVFLLYQKGSDSRIFQAQDRAIDNLKLKGIALISQFRFQLARESAHDAVSDTVVIGGKDLDPDTAECNLRRSWRSERIRQVLLKCRTGEIVRVFPIGQFNDVSSNALIQQFIFVTL
jgi:hypothetical protein